VNPSYTVQLPDFDLLRIVDNSYGSGNFIPPPATSEDITARFSNSGVLPQLNNFGNLDAYQRGGSPDLQLSHLLESRDQVVSEHHSPKAFIPPTNDNFSIWAESPSTSSTFQTVSEMDYSSFGSN